LLIARRRARARVARYIPRVNDGPGEAARNAEGELPSAKWGSVWWRRFDGVCVSGTLKNAYVRYVHNDIATVSVVAESYAGREVEEPVNRNVGQ